MTDMPDAPNKRLRDPAFVAAFEAALQRSRETIALLREARRVKPETWDFEITI
jgi:hypothetical protein